MKKPTSAELEILSILWEEGPKRVREVHDQLSESRDVFYTTTLKTMQVMVSKGFLTRDTSQRSHIYEAAIAQEEVEKSLIDGLVNGVFQGSATRLIVSALGHNKPTKEELEEIRSLLDNMEK